MSFTLSCFPDNLHYFLGRNLEPQVEYGAEASISISWVAISGTCICSNKAPKLLFRSQLSFDGGDWFLGNSFNPFTPC
jgi:hypothetical protein